MTKGILLIAFGKSAYAQMAVHMAASIKHFNPEVQITLLGDDGALFLCHKYKKVFDQLEHLPKHLLSNPGLCKLAIPQMLPYDVTLFLDCDGIATKDVSPLLEIEKDFAMILVGKGGFRDDINYMFWATNANAWEYFELDEDATFYAPQTSAMLFYKNSPKVKQLQSLLEVYSDYPLKKLKNHWGNCIPDELVYGGVTSKMNHNPDFGVPVVFFGHNYATSVKDVKEKFYVLSAYGNGRLVKDQYLDLYNRMAIRIMRRFGWNHLGDIRYLSKQKHVS